MSTTKAKKELIPASSASSLAVSQKSLTVPRSLLAVLQASLPKGSLDFFTPCQVGSHGGLRIICPVCQETAPRTVKPWNRWRWMAAHIRVEHA